MSFIKQTSSLHTINAAIESQRSLSREIGFGNPINDARPVVGLLKPWEINGVQQPDQRRAQS